MAGSSAPRPQRGLQDLGSHPCVFTFPCGFSLSSLSAHGTYEAKSLAFPPISQCSPTPIPLRPSLPSTSSLDFTELSSLTCHHGACQPTATPQTHGDPGNEASQLTFCVSAPLPCLPKDFPDSIPIQVFLAPEASGLVNILAALTSPQPSGRCLSQGSPSKTSLASPRVTEPAPPLTTGSRGSLLFSFITLDFPLCMPHPALPLTPWPLLS